MARTRRPPDSAGSWKISQIQGVSTHTSAKSTMPRTAPMVEAARMSSSFRSGFCTSEERQEKYNQVGQSHEAEGRRTDEPRSYSRIGHVGDYEGDGGKV